MTLSSSPLDAILTTAEVAAEIGCVADTVARIARESHKTKSPLEPLGRQIGGVWVFTRAQANKLARVIQSRPGHPGKD